jgi:hypothetical protein
MQVTDYGVYIEDACGIRDADEFVSFTDEHGAHIMLSKEIVREAYEFLKQRGESNADTKEN